MNNLVSILLILFLAGCVGDPIQEQRELRAKSIAEQKRVTTQKVEEYGRLIKEKVSECEASNDLRYDVAVCRAAVEIGAARQVGLPQDTRNFVAESAKLRIEIAELIDNGKLSRSEAAALYEIEKEKILSNIRENNKIRRNEKFERLRNDFPRHTECSENRGNVSCTTF